MRTALLRRIALGMGAWMSTAGVAGSVEYIPIYNLTLLGGQYFFAGSKSSLNGNAAGNVAPVVKFSERWTLMPVYTVNYQGTKAVTDAVGSGTLFQQMMNHRVSATGIYTPGESRWRLKPSVSYKREFLKETRDEAWGKGLFDYNKVGAGFEAENVYKDPFSYRLGYDFYWVNFPNFQSLESKSGVDPAGNPLGRETAGTSVLDTFNQQLSASASVPFPYNDPKVSVTAGYSALWQTFPDQNVVNSRGQYNDHSPRTRQDFLQSLNASVAWPKAVTVLGTPSRLVSRFATGLAYNGSNQNTFDAGRAQFVPDAYSYVSVSAGPNATLSWGDEKAPAWTSASFSWSRTNYLGRLAQQANGAYTADHQTQDRYVLGLAYGYPIAPSFSLRASANFLWAASNQAYEATYRYTYRSANYLFGFTYDY